MQSDYSLYAPALATHAGAVTLPQSHPASLALQQLANEFLAAGVSMLGERVGHQAARTLLALPARVDCIPVRAYVPSSVHPRIVTGFASELGICVAQGEPAATVAHEVSSPASCPSNSSRLIPST